MIGGSGKSDTLKADTLLNLIKDQLDIPKIYLYASSKLNSVVTELFIRGRKLNITLVFITETYFAIPRNVGLNSTRYFIMKIPSKSELQQITINCFSNIDLKRVKKVHKNVLQNHIRS